jgi:regulator of protease activity HflC (stomatin/prohibitin superfamily)
MLAGLIICVIITIVGLLLFFINRPEKIEVGTDSRGRKVKIENKDDDGDEEINFSAHTLGKWMSIAGGAVSVIFLILCSIVVVPTGNVAVMVRFERPTGQVLTQGMHLRNILDVPINMSIKTQLFTDDATAASKDLQDVSTTIALNYHLNVVKAVEVYQTIGHDYIGVIANPIIQETAKEITATFNAEDMIVKRPEVKSAIADTLTQRLESRGIVVESVNITNFEFSQSFTDAIEAKVVAAQNVLQATNKLEQVKVEAQMAKAKADGDAAAAMSRAEGQATANKTIEESLTDRVLQYYFIDKLGTDVKVWVVPSGQAFTIAPTP